MILGGNPCGLPPFLCSNTRECVRKYSFMCKIEIVVVMLNLR